VVTAIPGSGQVAARILNHLLAREAWARDRLAAHAGEHFRIEAGVLSIALGIDAEGQVLGEPAETEPAVVIQLGDDAAGRLLSAPETAFSAARITGSVRFAETLAFVFRNLRWDFEADLADLAGDIPARRIAQALRAAAAWQRDAVVRLGGNVAEYLTEESGSLVPSREVADFGRAVDQLRDDCARLEKRIARLAG
jgi:ubiquinone biosynthesis protein UbiJ